VIVLCRSGVRPKPAVNMMNTEESEFSRLAKEERTGPGWKRSRQKLPRQTVVGSIFNMFQGCLNRDKVSEN